MKKAPGKRKKINEKITVSSARKPGHLTETEWLQQLRKQVAELGFFTGNNTGEEVVYSDDPVYGPTAITTYKVAIRSLNNSRNFYNCPDFKTNGLGTCKYMAADAE